MEQMTSKAPSRWQQFLASDFFYYFKRDKVAMFSFAVFVSFVLAAVLAPLLSPSDPYDLSVIDIMDSELPPTWMEWGDERFLFFQSVLSDVDGYHPSSEPRPR